ncbi:MAG: putative RDD family membrane protein YckC [Crocinitomix sp.]|jgi:uncharacterized RDD family membrane protein YckC
MNRTEIDALIKKNIGQITLIGGLLGLIPLLLMFMSLLSSELLWNVFEWLSIAKPHVDFEFYTLGYLGNFYALSNLGYLYLPIIFYGVMLAGYFSLKNGSTIAYRLIRFSFSVIFISHLIGILWMILGVFGEDYYYGFGLHWVLGLVFKIAWAYIAFTLLRSDIKPVDEFGSVSSESKNDLVEATKGQRFVHHLIDSIVFMGVCTSILVFYGDSFIGELDYKVGSTITYLIIGIIARLMYYPIFETLFGATPGKFLTGSKVVKEDGSKITFDQSWIRTFSRIVPFEPFSFLGKDKGWHDAWSKTKVVITEERQDFGSDDVIDDF